MKGLPVSLALTLCIAFSEVADVTSKSTSHGKFLFIYLFPFLIQHKKNIGFNDIILYGHGAKTRSVINILSACPPTESK